METENRRKLASIYAAHGKRLRALRTEIKSLASAIAADAKGVWWVARIGPEHSISQLDLAQLAVEGAITCLRPAARRKRVAKREAKKR